MLCLVPVCYSQTDFVERNYTQHITVILFPDVYIVHGHTTCIYIIQTNNSKHTQLSCFLCNTKQGERKGTNFVFKCLHSTLSSNTCITNIQSMRQMKRITVHDGSVQMKVWTLCFHYQPLTGFRLAHQANLSSQLYQDLHQQNIVSFYITVDMLHLLKKDTTLCPHGQLLLQQKVSTQRMWRPGLEVQAAADHLQLFIIWEISKDCVKPIKTAPF